MQNTTPLTTSDPRDSYEEYDDADYVRMTLPVQVVSAIGFVILIVFAISGNVMTIIAYGTAKTHRSVYDFYIFNLAITDCLISTISMPFYAVYTLMEFTWPFGYTFCKFWLVVDFTCCFQSMLLMLLLSLDRLLVLSMGPFYTIRMTMNIAKYQMVFSWIISFSVYGPAILGWNHWVGSSTVLPDDCDVEFAYDFDFTATTAVIEFILPFIVLTTMNVVIYLKIRKRKQVSPTPTDTAPVAQNNVNTPATIPQSNAEPTTSTQSGQSTPEIIHKPNTEGESECSHENDNSSISRTPDQRQTQQIRRGKRTKNQSKKDMKAAQFLTILAVAFLLLWAPYTIATMAIAFCGDRCLNVSLYEFFTWILWLKSAINPLLYAKNSSFYRKHFVQYLSCNGKLRLCLNQQAVN